MQHVCLTPLNELVYEMRFFNALTIPPLIGSHLPALSLDPIDQPRREMPSSLGALTGT